MQPCRKTRGGRILKRPIKIKKCEHCEKEFSYKYKERKFCSKSCSARGNQTGGRNKGTIIKTADRHKHKVCPVCSRTFTNITPSVKYCSHECFVSTVRGVEKVPADIRRTKRRESNRKHNKIKRARRRQCETENFNDSEIYIRDRYKCHLCKGKINMLLRFPHPKSPSIDHLIPISMGGGHTKVNVKAAHLFCNMSKHNGSKQEQLEMFG